MISQYVGCRPTYGGGSMAITCAPGSTVRGLMYNTTDCTGGVVEESAMQLPTSCMMDATFQCNSNPSPVFVEKPGLTTL